MIASSLARIFAVALIFALSVGTIRAWPHKHSQKARVHFLATSTLVRSTWFWNEDTYLVELNLSLSNESVLVRLIDAYPPEAPPISRKVLTADSGASLRVRRDAECDRVFGQIVLRTAPGDPMAVLPERLGYDPPLTRTPDPNKVLPCYRIVR